jgi:nucleoside-diphosphate-sugar epimerase
MTLSILVTGGAGYIGSTLVPLLLAEGHFVTVVDTLAFQQVSLLGCFSHPRFRFVKADVCHEAIMKQLLAKADVVIPLAAIVGAPACNQQPVLAKLINYDAVQLILRNTSSQQKILFPNTNSGYGIGQKNQFCTEKTPLTPISTYGKFKVEIEEALLATGRAISFRLATVFGVSPRMRLDLLVNDFTFRACQDKFIVLFEEHFKRNYIHVRDVAGAFLFGLKNFDKMKGEAFNVGLSEANLSKRELCERIKTFVPELYIHSAPIGEDPDKRDYLVSNAKLETLGWAPTKTIDDGIQEIISAYPVLKMTSFKNV